MSIRTRLYRDGKGAVGSGSYTQFSMPALTNNIESISVYPWIYRTNDGQEGGGRIRGCSLQYSNDGVNWEDIYTNEQVYINYAQDSGYVRISINDPFTTAEQSNNFGMNYAGKKLKFTSLYSNELLENDGYLWYFEVYTTYKTPTISDPTVSRDFANYAVNVNTEINYYESYTISVNGNTYTNTKSIPESAFNVGDNSIVINVANGDMRASKTVSYNFIDYNPTAKSLSFTNSTLDYDTTVETTASNAQRYDLYVNGVFKHSASTQVFIPPRSAFSLGENSVFVRCYNTTSGRYADTSTYKKTFSTLQPTVSNIITSNTGDKGNNLTLNPTVLTWQGTNYSYFNIYVNNVLKASRVVGLTYTLPAYSIPYGQSTIKVEVVKEALSGIANTEIVKYLNTTITLDAIEPTVSNITLSTTNIDKDITITWDSKYQDAYEMLVQNASGTWRNIDCEGGVGKSWTIDKGGLNINDKKLKILVIMFTDDSDVEGYDEITLNLTCDMPVIYNLEPSNLNRNIEEAISATFSTNEYVNRWHLRAGTHTATGTTLREVVFGANTFVKGENELILTAYYTAKHANAPERVVHKAVSFTGYGKPNAPILDVQEVYNTSSPTFRWASNEEQTAYEYLVLDGTLQIKSGAVNTTDNFVYITGLENNKTYTLKVRLKNKYDLYSNWSIATFNTLFSNITLPSFYLIVGENSVQISIDGYQDADFRSISVYRKSGHDTWLEIANNCNSVDAITDYTCPLNREIEYKCRVYNTANAYRDTEIKTITVEAINYLLNNVEDFQSSFRMDFVQSATAHNRNVVYKTYSNQSSPRVFKGRVKYNTVSLSLEMANSVAEDFIYFIENANDYNIFCYRNWKGDKMFVSAVITDVTPVNSQIQQISLQLTQINFIEEKLYSGVGYRKIVYLDGSYLLDGSIDMSGYDDSVISPYVEVSNE